MDIKEIANKIKNNGGTLYLVGGALRDSLINVPVKDEDYCVVGINHNDFIKIFPEAKIKGKYFEVFEIEKKEFALARKEIKVGKGHKEFEIVSNEDISIEEDLSRRDITINAIARNVLTDEIIDPFNGREDIENKIIKAISNKFKEDPLRVYRVARFAASLNFKVESRTIKIMKELKEEMNTLSRERIFTEFKKALETDKPSTFFYILKKSELLDVHFLEINNLIGAIQPENYHPEGDSYNHTMLALDNSCEITKNAKIRFTALVHDLGKGETPKDMYPHHYGHDKLGIKPLKQLAKKIGIPANWEKCGETAILEHMKGRNIL